MEICRGLPNPGSRRVASYCKVLIGELGLSISEIDETKLERSYHDDDEVAVLMRKIVKAVHTKLRDLVVEAAIKKGVITVGKLLPAVGYWKGNTKTLVAIGTTKMLIVPKKEGDKQSGQTTHKDPLKNGDFLSLLV